MSGWWPIFSQIGASSSTNPTASIKVGNSNILKISSFSKVQPGKSARRSFISTKVSGLLSPSPSPSFPRLFLTCLIFVSMINNLTSQVKFEIKN